MANKHQILIVGGGSAGLTTAAHLIKKNKKLDVAVVDPAEYHYYQPLWTLVGGGVVGREKTQRSQSSVIPAGVQWIQQPVIEFDPESSSVTTADGSRIEYEFLIVCPGIQINWSAIPGLEETLGKHGVCSNYSYDTVNSTWEFIRNFKGGAAFFTEPDTPIKCGGAPQKIMYLAEDYFRRHGIRDQCTLTYVSPKDRIFPVDKYAQTLEGVIERRHMNTLFGHVLTEVRGAEQQAVFRDIASGEEKLEHYDLLHVTPPMGPPDFVAHSPLAAADGWVDVDPATLQHTRYQNVFSLGDCSSLPTSKTGAAIRKQAPVVVANLISAISGQPLAAKYDGYTSCPLVTAYGKLVLAEFDYDKQPAETFPFDQSKERWSMYMLKKIGLPFLYWHGMLKGRA